VKKNPNRKAKKQKNIKVEKKVFLYIFSNFSKTFIFSIL